MTDQSNECESLWATIERLPTLERLKTSLLDYSEIGGGSEAKGKQVVDVTKLREAERRLFIESLIKHVESDNLRLLQQQKERTDRVNVKLPTIEVRYENLCVEAECQVVEGKPLPTLLNAAKHISSVLLRSLGFKYEGAKISIIKDVSGIIKPSRMALLLGAPGCGKSTFLRALAGKLDKSLKVTGEVSYNGFKLEEFVPEKTSSYVTQHDLHMPEMTVREILDFSARFQGVGSRAEIMKELIRREKQAGIVPKPDIDMYMKAISVEGLERSVATDYVLKILGLDSCADTVVGDAMRRGISGGEKKRVTTGEIIVGPTKALFMDEISTGLDSSTTFRTVTCLQQLTHITEATVVVSLLQPAPETYELFDDIILMAEGKIAYQGPRSQVLTFFEECGFRCPERKGVGDFLQEILSRKDQKQYWHHPQEDYSYVSADQFSERFRTSHIGQSLASELSELYDKSQGHKNALSANVYSLPKRELLKACMARELLLMRRNSFVYIFKTAQIAVIGVITMSLFLHTHMELDAEHANSYLSSLFFALILFMVNGFPEIIMILSRLPGFYKQIDLNFYPAWAYAIPAIILKIPISLVESLIWTSLTYYVIGYSPEAVRFFRQFLILFLVHQMFLSLFRFIASYLQTRVASSLTGTLCTMTFAVCGGFIIPRSSMPAWLKWGYWVSPFTYPEIGLAINEFLAPRWQKNSLANTTIGHQILASHGLNYNSYFYWISVGALIGYIILFNVAFIFALTFKRPNAKSHAIISREKLAQIQSQTENSNTGFPANAREPTKTGRTLLPFAPLSIVFKDLQYYVETPPAMRKQGYAREKFHLLTNITGAFRPGILSALMGVSGAGKTTLLDVLSGRKTTGTIEGDIRIGSYPKVQETFERISGYCEQTDIHSPQLTVEESIIFSAWLRLPHEIDKTTRSEFVNEVLETIELDGIKDALVGVPGVNGLSTEQRKRLTIAVELVSNPSIILMDEPTSGLDARSAAIVMRAVKNVAQTGRTVVCTIHQPSIDIFEAFDELMLIKKGGELIYSGAIGQHSSEVIKYFEDIPGVPKMKVDYNPATWMLEVTSMSVEAQLEVDFAHIYKESALYKNTKDLVKQLSVPPPGSRDLKFPNRFPQNSWGQIKACLWKQYLSYWRSPSYNLVRITFILLAAVIFGALFWKHGKKLNNQQSLFNTLGLMYLATILTGVNNCLSTIPFIATERAVLYREKFAGMYSAWAYSFAQVAIEIPYAFLLALLFTSISYPAIGFYWSAYKFSWFFYSTFCTILTYVYLGMLLVSLTPNAQVATILASFLFQVLNLFSGFLIPGPQIPKWLNWFYHIMPTSWALRSFFASQYGDIDDEITVFGEPKSVATFLEDYYGFHRDQLGMTAVVLIAFPIIFAILFACLIGKLSFQRR